MSAKRVRPAKIQQAAAGTNERPVDGIAPEEIVATAERHVNGVPMSQIPERARALIGYDMTDEGIAEKNARRVDSQGRPHSGIQVLVNEGFDQAILKRSRAEEAWDTADPLLDAVNLHKEPGFRYRGLSPAVIRKKGMRGWESVADKGAVVTAGNLIVAKMPIERAERRNKKFRDIGNENAAAAAGRFIEDHDKSTRDSGSEGVRVLHAGDTMADPGDPNRRLSIGVHSSQG